MSTVVDELQFEPVGAHSSGLDISSAVAPTRPAGATKLMIQVIDENARYTLQADSIPTTSAGFKLVSGNDPYILHIHPNSVFRLIEEAATCIPQLQWGK